MEVLVTNTLSLSAVSSLAMMQADLVGDMADRYHQLGPTCPVSSILTKTLFICGERGVCACVYVFLFLCGHMNDEFPLLKVTSEESSISPVNVSHYLL